MMCNIRSKDEYKKPNGQDTDKTRDNKITIVIMNDRITIMYV